MNFLSQQSFKQLIDDELLSHLKQAKRGLEKEGLRVSATGDLAQTKHPHLLGSALTNPYITTDYSEALLEFITPPKQDHHALAFLNHIHQWVYQSIAPELLWVCSMPCYIAKEQDITIAQYGSSNSGKMKTIYRHGLWHRYGRHMQAIAGIHYNYSFPQSFWSYLQAKQENKAPLQQFIDESYLKLIRNFQRHCWLLSYLFGASPTFDVSLLNNPKLNLPQHIRSLFHKHGQNTYYAPYATSLRMSHIGYENHTQSNLPICYNTLNTYIKGLDHATQTPFSEFEQIGILDQNNMHRQLNTHLLQIENEYYSNIRPKRSTKSNERPIRALQQRGIEYLEIRCLDLNPLETMGISHSQMFFLDLFLLFCLLQPSPPTNHAEQKQIRAITEIVVYQGRNPETTLPIANSQVKLRDQGTAILNALEPIAKWLDQSNDSNAYQNSIADQHKKISDADLTPSAIVLQKILNSGASFHEFGMQVAQQQKQKIQQTPLPEKYQNFFSKSAKESLNQQQEMEHNDKINLLEFISQYFQS